MADLKITTKEQLGQAASMGAAALGQLAQTVADALDEAYIEVGKKYDSANIEAGSGSLTVAAASASRIKSAVFEYQKIGAFVKIYLTIEFAACTVPSEKTAIQFSGLPYVCTNEVNPRILCVTTAKQQLICAIGAKTSIVSLIMTSANTSFTDGEKLSFAIDYKVN